MRGMGKLLANQFCFFVVFVWWWDGNLRCGNRETTNICYYLMFKAHALIWARKIIWSVSFHRRLQSEYKVIKEKLLSLQNWETNVDHQRGWPIRLMVWWLGDDEYLILVDMKCLAGVPLCDRMAVLLISVIFTARVLTTDIWVTLIVWSSWCSDPASSHPWLSQLRQQRLFKIFNWARNETL